MTALGRKAIEVRLIAELRALPPGDKPQMGTIRKAIAAELGQCSPAELAAAIQALRYQGKLAWDGLELSQSMIEQDAAPCAAEGGADHTPSSTDAAGSAEPVVEGGAEAGRVVPVEVPPSDDPEDDYPGEVNDVAGGAPPAAPAAGPIPPPVVARERPLPAVAHERAVTGSGSFVPKALLHKAGVHAASTRAGSRPLPVPAHEPEIARQVREEAEELRSRRYRARSTGTVRVPLELRKFGVPDLSFGEGVATMLAETPHDLIAAVHRKHPQLWKRVIQLGRAEQRRPAEALYAALERGLDELEAPQQEVSNAA